MALAVPDAFQDEAAWFAVAYFVVRVLQLDALLWGVRGDPAPPRWRGSRRGSRRGRRSSSSAASSTRTTAAGCGSRRSPSTSSGRCVAARDWRVSPSHFAERFALIVIIALGESIVAIGIGTSGLPRDTTYALSVIVAFAGVAALWWAYFDFTAVAAERALRRASPRRAGRWPATSSRTSTTRWCSGSSSTRSRRRRRSSIRSTRCREAGRWALGLGIAIFLVGFALMRFRVVRRVAWERLAAAVLSLVVAVVLDGADAIATLGVVIVILVLSVALETARLRELRAEIRAG